MKRIVICNIPLYEKKPVKYMCDDKSFPLIDSEVIYPVNSLLGGIIKKDEHLKVLLLAKNGEHSVSCENCERFKCELESINKSIGAKIEYKIIETDFKQTLSVHSELMGKIVDEIDNESHLLVDITYGSKDIPIVEFSALNFAQKFLNCEIENIVYGQSDFVDNKPVNTKICDMSPLYYMNSVVDLINTNNPNSAREMLKALLSL